MAVCVKLRKARNVTIVLFSLNLSQVSAYRAGRNLYSGCPSCPPGSCEGLNGLIKSPLCGCPVVVGPHWQPLLGLLPEPLVFLGGRWQCCLRAKLGSGNSAQTGSPSVRDPASFEALTVIPSGSCYLQEFPSPNRTSNNTCFLVFRNTLSLSPSPIPFT